MSKSKRILLISLGSIGCRHLRNIRTLMPEAVLCVWRHKQSARPTGLEGIDIVYSLADALAFTPDAVLVSSPAPFHAEQCAPFAELGLPVFVEKPLEVSTAALLPLEKAMAKGKGLLFVGYVLRFQPILAELRERIDDGIVGVVRTAHIATGQYLPDWRPDCDYRDGVSAKSELGGGVLLELSHELDYARWFFGVPETISAQLGKFGELDMDVEDNATVICGYRKQQVTVNVDFLQRVPSMTLKVVGAEGTLHANLIDETAVVLSPNGKVQLELQKMENGNEMYLRQFDAFLSRAFSDHKVHYEGSATAPFATLDDARGVLEMTDAARTSSKTGRRVHI